jgi:hypothetical protein
MYYHEVKISKYRKSLIKHYGMYKKWFGVINAR